MQLFGSSYTVYIIAVLVIAVIALVVVRMKQRGEPGAKAEKVTEPPAVKNTRESRKAKALAARTAEAEAMEATAVEETVAQMPGANAVAGAAEAPEAALVSGAGAGAGGAESIAQPGAAPAQEAGPVIPEAPETPAAPAGGRFGHDKHAQPDVPAAPPLATVSADPLQTIIISILQGWGDLSTEDTNRLALFRQDKVVETLASLELPKELKGSEYAKTRLTQLRAYASHLGRGERPAPPEETEHEFAGMAFPAAAAAAATTAPAATAPPAPQIAVTPLVTPAATSAVTPAVTPAATSAATPAVTPAATLAASVAALMATSAATPAAITTPAEAVKAPGNEPAAPTPVAPREPVGDASHAFAVPKDATESWDAPDKWADVKVTPASNDPWGQEEEESASAERAAEFDWGNAENHIPPVSADLKSADLAWNGGPAAGVSAGNAQQPVAEPLGTFDAAAWDKPAAAPEAPVSSPTETADAHRTAEAAVAAAAAAFWNTPEAPAMEKAVSPSKPDQGLGKRVSTAADIMGLPISERADMLAFLEPAELSRVFVLAADKDLKKSVIETLEHIGNTSALDALRDCLEDPDPEVQLYALDAADRMLGTAS
jgi:hypothetical protein